jgi:hypothetical protein
LLELWHELIDLRKPVAYVHGDSHYLRIDKSFLDSQGRASKPLRGSKRSAATLVTAQMTSTRSRCSCTLAAARYSPASRKLFRPTESRFPLRRERLGSAGVSQHASGEARKRRASFPPAALRSLVQKPSRTTLFAAPSFRQSFFSGGIHRVVFRGLRIPLNSVGNRSGKPVCCPIDSIRLQIVGTKWSG